MMDEGEKLQQLVEMGFDEHRAQRALEKKESIDGAVQHLLGRSNSCVQRINCLKKMGFSESGARTALTTCDTLEDALVHLSKELESDGDTDVDEAPKGESARAAPSMLDAATATTTTTTTTPETPSEDKGEGEGEGDASKGEDEDSEEDERPMCQYGLACFRRNPEHLRRFRHPPGWRPRRRRKADKPERVGHDRPRARTDAALSDSESIPTTPVPLRRRVSMHRGDAASDTEDAAERAAVDRTLPSASDDEEDEEEAAPARPTHTRTQGRKHARSGSEEPERRTRHRPTHRRRAPARDGDGDGDSDNGDDNDNDRDKDGSGSPPPPRKGKGKGKGDAHGRGGHLTHVRKRTGPQPVLLAEKWNSSIDCTGWYLSEKLDGVRAYWDGACFYSRLGNRFAAPGWFKKDFPEYPLDGELWLGRGVFEDTVRIVKKKDPHDGWRDLKYMVFDLPSHHGPWESRLRAMRSIRATHITVVEQLRCEGEEHMKRELARVEALGGEGLMLRQPGSHYVAKRSPTLLKVKSFHDADARVVGHVPGTGRLHAMMGALLCETIPNGTLFKVGTGFSDKQRRKPPKIGSVIIYKFQELSKKGVPRFPVYVGLRAD